MMSGGYYFFPVQLRGSHSRPSWNDSEAAGAGDWLQDYGARKGIHEGQEKGTVSEGVLYPQYPVFQEELNRGKPNWEHLDDELHVLIQVRIDFLVILIDLQ